MNLKDLKLYNQNDYYSIKYPSSTNKSATVKTSGCGVVCLAFILANKLGLKVNIKDLANFSIDCGARVNTGTDMKVLLNNASTLFGFDYQMTSNLEDFKNAINNNYFVIINVDGNDGVEGIFSNGGHYLVGVTYIDNKLICFDPGWYKTKYSSQYRSLFVSNYYKELIQTSTEAVDIDTVYRNPRFYIIKTANIEEDDNMIRYEKLKDIPNKDGFRDIIEKLMDAGIIKGSSSDKEKSIINLSEDQIRTIVFVYRGGGFNSVLNK